MKTKKQIFASNMFCACRDLTSRVRTRYAQLLRHCQRCARWRSRRRRWRQHITATVDLEKRIFIFELKKLMFCYLLLWGTESRGVVPVVVSSTALPSTFVATSCVLVLVLVLFVAAVSVDAMRGESTLAIMLPITLLRRSPLLALRGVELFELRGVVLLVIELLKLPLLLLLFGLLLLLLLLWALWWLLLIIIALVLNAVDERLMSSSGPRYRCCHYGGSCLIVEKNRITCRCSCICNQKSKR